MYNQLREDRLILSRSSGWHLTQALKMCTGFHQSVKKPGEGISSRETLIKVSETQKSIYQRQELRLEKAETLLTLRGTHTNDVKELDPIQEYWEAS